eukprot:UN31628
MSQYRNNVTGLSNNRFNEAVGQTASPYTPCGLFLQTASTTGMNSAGNLAPYNNLSMYPAYANATLSFPYSTMPYTHQVIYMPNAPLVAYNQPMNQNPAVPCVQLIYSHSPSVMSEQQTPISRSCSRSVEPVMDAGVVPTRDRSATNSQSRSFRERSSSRTEY